MELEGAHLRAVKAGLKGWGAVHRSERVEREWHEPRPGGQACRALGVATRQGGCSNCTGGCTPSWPGSRQQTVLVRDTAGSHRPWRVSASITAPHWLLGWLLHKQTTDVLLARPLHHLAVPPPPPQPTEEPGMGPLAETSNPSHSSASSLPFSILPAGAKTFPRLTVGGRRYLSGQWIQL